jgi:mRNA interferase MazF
VSRTGDGPRAKRSDIWPTRLDPTEGHEIQKTRPCLIVSPDSMNGFVGTVTVLPLTSGARAAPFRIAVSFQGRAGLLLADQVRSVSHRRLLKHLGGCDDETVSAALLVLREMFEDE